MMDLDGVVYRGRRVLPGAVEFFEQVRRRGEPLVVVTNNATATVGQYLERLFAMGIRLERRQIVSSALAAAFYLRRRGVSGPVLAVGEDGLREALAQSGIEAYFVEDGRPVLPVKAVVVGLDRRFGYEKLRAACRAVRDGAELVGTNPDVTYPTEDGEEPGCGALLAAIAACAGASPVVVGKPNRVIVEMALERLGVAGEDRRSVVAVGDRLETDVAMAHETGLTSVLVLSGVARREEVDASPVCPDHVFEDLAALSAAWLQ